MDGWYFMIIILRTICTQLIHLSGLQQRKSIINEETMPCIFFSYLIPPSMSGNNRKRWKRCWQGYSGEACCHFAPVWKKVNTVQALTNGAVQGITDSGFVNRTVALPSDGCGANEPQEKSLSRAAARSYRNCQISMCVSVNALTHAVAYFVLHYEGCCLI